jgi:hypothetical protein
VRDAILASLEADTKYLDRVSITDRLGSVWFACGAQEDRACNMSFVEDFELELDIGSGAMASNVSNPFARDLFGAPKCSYRELAAK